MTTRTAYSQQSSPQDAVRELATRLAGPKPRLVVYFASSHYVPEEIAAEMQRAFAPAALLGCTTAGELVGGVMHKNSVVAIALGADVIEAVQVEVVTDLSNPDALVGPFASIASHFKVPNAMELDTDRHVGIVLVDGLSGAEERLMERIGNQTDVIFIGGSAGDDLRFQATHVFANGRSYRNAAILAVIRAANGFGIVKTQSFRTHGKKLVATRVREDQREVLEFDGKPAAQAYAEALGVPATTAAEQFMSHPLGLVARGDIFVRSPQQVTAEGAIRFYCSIQAGTELAILTATDMIQDTVHAVEAKREELGGISALLNFNCILRTLELEKTGRTQAYGKLFEGLPMVGFSTYGEQYLGHINQTATMLAFH